MFAGFLLLTSFENVHSLASLVTELVLNGAELAYHNASSGTLPVMNAIGRIVINCPYTYLVGRRSSSVIGLFFEIA
ncbi:hypothetical protein F4859DRAFT_302128 [Xylaria cf. heliscus]|nr:hypothetical protein F4859DRAFT_302128 [Xylaria cf. heliscus]